MGDDKDNGVQQNGIGYANPAFHSEDNDKTENGVAPPTVSAAVEAAPDNKTEVTTAQQAKRDRNPLFYCKLITNYPKTAFGLTLGGHIMMMVITVLLAMSGYDILPITFDQLPLEIRDDVDYLRGLAWQERQEDTEIIARGVTKDNTVPLRSVAVDFLQLIFREKNGNVFTKENLLRIQKVEDDFFYNEEFQNDFCHLVGGQCGTPSSILRFFDGSLGPYFNDPDFNDIVGIINRANTLNETKRWLQNFLGRDYIINSTYVKSEITQSMMQVGYPLEGFINDTDREDEQEVKLKKFMRENFLKKGEEYFKTGVGPMEFVYSSVTLIFLFITKQVFLDMALAIGSFFFIVVFICIQTGSLWVGLFAVMSIQTSFFGANIIYRCILDYRYFGIFHVLALFIILGIGADDVFVFYDNWKETGHHEYKSVAHRLSDCYRKAALAMLFTSLTTAIAFICSASSPFLGISSFGVFAGILVSVNYISVVIFFPTVVVTYHNYWEKYKCCCCCPKDASVHASSEGINHPEVPPPGMPVQRKNPVVRFFRGPYYQFITHKIMRWFIIMIIGAVLGVFIYYCTKLKVNDEQTKFLPDDSNLGKFLIWRANYFSTGSDSNGRSQVKLVWGLELQDLSACHKTDPQCFGKTVWDENFNLNAPEAQEALLDFCERIRNLDDKTIADLHIKRSLIDNRPEVTCFIKTMKDFYDSQPQGVVPFLSSHANDVMSANTDVYYKNIPNGFNEWFTIGMSYWLHNGFHAVNGLEDPLWKYGNYLGEAPDGDYTQNVTTPSNRLEVNYFYATKLRYACIVVNTTMSTSTISYTEGLPIRNNWENWMQNQVKTLPDELRGGFQTTSEAGYNTWHSLKVQKNLVSSAVMGIIVGLCCALPILVIATQNIITGLLATFSICCVITCVVGVIPMGGWKLGMLESLNLVLVVGLSVDYVVHLAEGYSRSLHRDHLGRVHDMLEEVGISVLSGAFTTLGASFFLLFAEILFFTQFGMFMFSTIGLSLLFSLGLFTTFMGIIGPENDCGSLGALFRAITRCCKRN